MPDLNELDFFIERCRKEMLPPARENELEQSENAKKADKINTDTKMLLMRNRFIRKL